MNETHFFSLRLNHIGASGLTEKIHTVDTCPGNSGSLWQTSWHPIKRIMTLLSRFVL